MSARHSTGHRVPRPTHNRWHDLDMFGMFIAGLGIGLTIALVLIKFHAV